MLRFPPYLLVCAMLTGCGDASGGARAVVRDSAGITIVENQNAPADTVRLDSPVVRIGQRGLDAAEEYTFVLVSDVAAAPGGDVVVVDNRGGRIAVFDRDGRWLRDVGRQGAGPGEYVAPLRAAVRGDTLFAWDVRLRRLSQWHLDGEEFLSSVSIREHTAGLPIVPVSGGYVAETESGQVLDPEPARAALVLRDRAGAVLDTLVGPYPVPEVGYEWIEEGQSFMMVNSPVFGVRSPWTVRDDVVLWTPPGRAEIRALDPTTGAIRSIIRLDRAVAPPTDAAKEAYVRAQAARMEADAERTARLRESLTYADVVPAVARLMVDDRGRVWVAGVDPVQPRDRDWAGSVWDVLDPDGRLLRRVELPASFELMAVAGGRAYGVATDAFDVQVVDVYDVAPSRHALETAPPSIDGETACAPC